MSSVSEKKIFKHFCTLMFLKVKLIPLYNQYLLRVHSMLSALLCAYNDLMKQLFLE